MKVGPRLCQGWCPVNFTGCCLIRFAEVYVEPIAKRFRVLMSFLTAGFGNRLFRILEFERSDLMLYGSSFLIIVAGPNGAYSTQQAFFNQPCTTL